MICDITNPFPQAVIGSEARVAARRSTVSGHIRARGIPKIGLRDIQQRIYVAPRRHEPGQGGLKRRRTITGEKRLRRHRLLLGLTNRRAHQPRLGPKRRLRRHQLRNVSIQHTHPRNPFIHCLPLPHTHIQLWSPFPFVGSGPHVPGTIGMGGPLPNPLLLNVANPAAVAMVSLSTVPVNPSGPAPRSDLTADATNSRSACVLQSGSTSTFISANSSAWSCISDRRRRRTRVLPRVSAATAGAAGIALPGALGSSW